MPGSMTRIVTMRRAPARLKRPDASLNHAQIEAPATAGRKSRCRFQRPPQCRWRSVTLGICGLIGLAVIDRALGAEDRFDGVYTGKRVLTKGSGPTCPSGDDVSVTIHGRVLTFTNSALRDFPLSFDPYRDGSFGEIYTDIGGAYVLVHGRIVGDVLDADVTSSACEHHWHLKRGQ